MTSSTLSPVRASFRAGLRQIQHYPVAAEWRPAFMTPVTALPRPTRRPLPVLAHPLPSRRPFAGQSYTLASAQQAMTTGTLTAVELVEHALGQIAQRDRELNAFVYVAPAEELLAQAAELDRERRAGQVRGPLHGITIAVKDLLDVAGMPNTASSPVLADHVSTQDGGAIRLLKVAGALITGKTHTHEFALGVTTPQSRNPWDPTRNCGGSSGGSGIAVATGMSIAAMCTDTRASVRVPAALCGVVGFKPTFGLIPPDGVIMLSWSLDHVCHMGATVEDAAILLDTLAPERTEERTESYADWLNRDVRGLRIGVPLAALEGADSAVLAAFEQSITALRACGVVVVETLTPTAADLDLAVLMGLVVSRCEAAAYHTAFGAERQYGTVAVAEQMAEAAHVSAVDYLQAQRARADLRQRMMAQLHDLDGWLMPTCRVAAPENDKVDQYFLVLSQNCILWSFIGFPVMSVPCGWTSNGLPVGAQLVTGPLEDGRLIALASALELQLMG